MCVDTVITDELQMWISLCQNVWQLEFLPLCCDLSWQKYLAESTAWGNILRLAGEKKMD